MNGSLGWLTARPFALRGVCRPAAVENTLAAFEQAVVAGLGIELDVHLGADGSVLVHHDADMVRCSGLPRRVETITAAEARTLRLFGSDQHLPTLIETLELIDGRVPVLIDLKPQPFPVGELEAQVADRLASYRGPAAVTAFGSDQLGWFVDHAPQVLRGQSVGGRPDHAWLSPPVLDAVNALQTLDVSRPDFLVANIEQLPNLRVIAARDAGLPVLGWVATSPEEIARSAGWVDQVLVSGFVPRPGGR